MRTASYPVVPHASNADSPSLGWCRETSVAKTSPLPQILWIAFVLTQAIDGGLTSLGIQALGISIEGNPLIVWYAHVVGPVAAIWGAKLFAVGCGIILYLTAQHRTIAALVFMYLACAIVPWLHLLSSGA